MIGVQKNLYKPVYKCVHVSAWGTKINNGLQVSLSKSLIPILGYPNAVLHATYKPGDVLHPEIGSYCNHLASGTDAFKFSALAHRLRHSNDYG